MGFEFRPGRFRVPLFTDGFRIIFFYRGCHLGSASVPITAMFCFIFYYFILYLYVSDYHLLTVLTFGFRFLVADGCEFRCPFGVVPCALHMLMPIIDAPRPDVCYVQLVSEVCSNTRWRKAAEHTEMQHLAWNFLSFLCCEHELANK